MTDIEIATDPCRAEVVGQPDPVLLDAARRAGEVLSELVRVEAAIETVVAQIDRGRRGQLSGVVARLGELRAKLRPVASLDIDARERALADERETSARVEVARIGERKPSAGWVELAGNYYLAAGDVFARANPSGWWWVYRGRWTPAEWRRTSHRAIREGKTASRIGAAMSGAEDALLAIAAEIVGAVGR